MHVWIARNPDKTRIRLEVDGHPGILQFHGWELREGDISDAMYEALCASRDEVEIESLHQSLWASLAS